MKNLSTTIMGLSNHMKETSVAIKSFLESFYIGHLNTCVMDEFGKIHISINSFMMSAKTAKTTTPDYTKIDALNKMGLTTQFIPEKYYFQLIDNKENKKIVKDELSDLGAQNIIFVSNGDFIKEIKFSINPSARLIYEFASNKENLCKNASDKLAKVDSILEEYFAKYLHMKPTVTTIDNLGVIHSNIQWIKHHKELQYYKDVPEMKEYETMFDLKMNSNDRVYLLDTIENQNKIEIVISQLPNAKIGTMVLKRKELTQNGKEESFNIISSINLELC